MSTDKILLLTWPTPTKAVHKSPEKFYPESAVADKIGIARDELKLLRSELLKKKRGDWKKERRQILLSAPGLTRIVKYLAESTGAEPLLIDDFEDCAIEEKKDPELVELTVKRTYPNPKILLAIFGDDESDRHPVRVKVPSNENFRPKMKLTARPYKNGMYRLVGRCPRYPGRW